MQASGAQSHLRFPLTRLFASAGHVRVLRALVSYGAPLSVAQIASDAGMTPRGTRFVLDSLVSQGIVGVLGQPRSQLFTVVAAHPMAEALTMLYASERARWEALQDGLREGLTAQRAIRSAWLYGSVARGEDEPRSDVDMALVVNDDALTVTQQVRDAVLALGDKLSVHLSATVLTPGDVAKLPSDDAWWAGLVRNAKVLKGVSPAQEAARCARLAAAV